MLHFKHPDTGEIFAYETEKERKQFGATSLVKLSDKQLAELRASQANPKDEIRNQIYALEGTVTPRRIREAVLGVDGGWLARVEAQIVALRGEL